MRWFSRALPPGRMAARGFTLVEMMVVVVIIGVLATIAVPSMVERIRERRSAEAAQRVTQLYRQARLRAMGRGAAVLVRFRNGSFNVYEAVVGGSAGSCANLPSSTCTPRDWSDTTLRHDVTAFQVKNRPEYEGVSISSSAGDWDACFTPMGAAYQSTGGAALSPMVGVRTFQVSRSGAGITRTVTVLPNGVARLAL